MRPKKCDVRLLSIAEDDIAEIVAFIAQDNPDAALKLADKIESRLARLADFPSLGRIPAEEELAVLGYRYLIVENYLVFYTVTAKTVLIHRILHGARDYLNLL
ncbi:MAG: type II toxin-antitoxin system RelE/ParE family toxin [Nitrospirae bacterium]|nr:type II toxin-antitoxin system RelE/ParE family toxin [Nitrospirota bacterium]